MTGDAEGAAVPRRVWSGTSLQVAGRLWGSACTFAALALLSRHLGPAEFGRYTFYLAVFGLLDGLTDFGTGAVAIQRTAGDRWALPGVLRVGRRIRLTTGTLGAAAVAAYAFAVGEAGAGWIALAGLYEPTHALELSSVVFKNRIEWRIPVLLRSIAAALRLGLVVALVLAGAQGAAIFVFGTALGSATANGLLHLASRPHLPRPTIAVAPPRGLLRAALPLGLAGICQQLYFYVDNVFVRALEGDAALGLYNAGVRLLSFGILLAQVSTAAALPWLARCRERGELDLATARLGQPLFALGCAGAGLLWPLAGPLLELVFGPGYGAAAASLRWLLLALAAVYAGAVLVTAVVACGSTRAVLVVTAVGLAANLAGNAWLVPRLGYEGAAIATAGTELVVAIGALLALTAAGCPLWRRRPWGWALGPAAFLAALGLSRALAAWAGVAA